MQPVVAVQDWGDALMTSMTGALMVFMGAIPKIIAFVLILVIGWFVAGLIAKAVAVVLRKVRFNDIAERAGIAGFVQKMGIETDASGFIASVVKWFIRLLTLVVAFDALGLPAVSDFLRQVLLWIPNLVVALMVLVIGGLAAKALSNLVRGAADEAGVGDPEVLATIARVGVWTFSIIIAVNQIGVGVTIVNSLFMATVGALALALGLAFGIGGKDIAAKIVEDWYGKGKAKRVPRPRSDADA